MLGAGLVFYIDSRNQKYYQSETPIRRAKIRGLQKVLEKGYPVRVKSKGKKGTTKKTIIKEKNSFTPPAEPKKMTMEEMQKFLNLNE